VQFLFVTEGEFFDPNSLTAFRFWFVFIFKGGFLPSFVFTSFFAFGAPFAFAEICFALCAF
jgi:hypothetical protein